MFERSLGRRWDLKGSVSNPVHAFSFPNIELNVYKYTNQDYFWTCTFRNLESCRMQIPLFFICISFLKPPYAYVQAVRRICWLLLCLNGFSTVDSVWGGLIFLFLLLLLGKVILHHTNLNVWMHQILVRWLFSVSTLVCHYIKYTMCCVMLFYLGRRLAWNEHPGTTGGTRRREGGSDYVRISLLWLISSVPSLSLSCCLFESLSFFSMVGCTSLSYHENCSKMVAMEAFPHRTSFSSQPLKYSKLLSDFAGAFQIVLMVIV